MTQPLTFVVLSTNLDGSKEIRSKLSSEPDARLLAGGDDAEQLFEEIKRLRPSACIVSLDASVEQSLAFVRRVTNECPATAVICASKDSSPDLILQALRSGAREFLRLPIITEEFQTVLKRINEFSGTVQEAPKKRGRTVAVFSSKGGCGTSFIATNIAAAMNAPTVLVDLNLQAGDLALFLGVDPKFSIADFVENRERIDDSLLKSYITPHTANLSLLSAPREADSADDIEPEHIYDVIERLRERYDYTVIDPQHTFDAITLAALDQCDDIILVLTLDIPAIRSAQRSLKLFDRLGYPRHKVRVVVNRWSKQIDLDLQQVERFLGEKVVGFVQSDYRAAVNSINLGQPLVNSDAASKLAAEIRSIAHAVCGESANVPFPAMAIDERRNAWAKLFRRQKAQQSEAKFDLHATLDRA